MLHVNLYLYQPKIESPTRIFARFFCNGIRFKYKTGISIHPQFWDFEKQRIKSSIKVPHHLELNNQLEKIISVSIKSYWEYRDTHDGQSPSMLELKQTVDGKLNRRKIEKKMDFLEFFQKLIDQSTSGVRLNPANGKPIRPSTVQTYVTTINHIKDYQKLSKRTIHFDSIDLLFYNQYTEYLIKELKLSSNSVGKNIQVIKLIMNEAVELGLCKNIAYKSKRFLTIREKSDSIYLEKRELQEMEELDLSGHPKLENVRDLFLIGCYTGLRYSDYSTIKPEYIKNGYLEITQAKTGSPVIIPLHDVILKILEKNKGRLPKPISIQKNNEYLKEIGQKIPLLKAAFVKSMTKEGIKKKSIYQKWEMVTSHTARRSFATNEYLAGTPTLTIMAITGHKTEKSFLRYIKLTSIEHAKLLKGHWEERKTKAALSVA
jgi:Phage integrase SAM-like domain/Phage integrase family/Arm DNA-binding domain